MVPLIRPIRFNKAGFYHQSQSLLGPIENLENIEKLGTYNTLGT